MLFGLFGVLGFDKTLQVSKAYLPESAVFVQPGIDGAERFGIELVDTVAAFAMFPHQVRAAQKAQMFGDGGAGNGESSGNVTGGLSGPAIKPLALRAVWRIAQMKSIPVIAVGGIGTIDDVMEFLVVGASAVQVGTANFYDPTASVRIVDSLPEALGALGANSVSEVGTIRM